MLDRLRRGGRVTGRREWVEEDGKLIEKLGEREREIEIKRKRETERQRERKTERDRQTEKDREKQRKGRGKGWSEKKERRSPDERSKILKNC